MDWSDKPPLPALPADPNDRRHPPRRHDHGPRRALAHRSRSGRRIGGEPGLLHLPDAGTQVDPSDDGTTTPTESARPDEDCPDKAADTESDASTG
jgi:hypothetical protein